MTKDMRGMSHNGREAPFGGAVIGTFKRLFRIATGRPHAENARRILIALIGAPLPETPCRSSVTTEDMRRRRVRFRDA